MKIFGREPALWLEAIKAVVVLLALILPGLSYDVQVAVMVIATAVFGLLQAATTRPFQVAALKEFVQTVGVSIAAFGIDLSPTALAAVVLLVGAVSALLTRTQVTPAVAPQPIA